MIARLNKLFSLLSPAEKRSFFVLVTLNALAALSEVLGIFSVLPFLAVAGDTSVIKSNPALASLYAWSGLQSHYDFVIVLGLFTIGAIVLTNCIGIVSLWYRTKFCYGVIAAMSDRLFRGYLAQPYSFFLRRNTNVLAKDLLNETQGFFANILDPVTSILARGLQLIFVIAALLVYNWKAALSAGVLFGGFYCVIYLLLHSRLGRIGNVRWACNERRYQLIGEALSGMKEVRLYSREKWYADNFQLESTRLGSLQGRGFLYGVSPRYLLETMAFSALVAYVLIELYNKKNLTEILPLLGIFAVAGVRVMPAVQIVFQYASHLRTNWIGVERLSSLFAEVNASCRAPDLPIPATIRLPLREGLVLESLHFAYPGTTKSVLTGVSVSIPARACVGFCGESGAGKTTLMDLCLGLIEPDRGQIRVDGRIIDDLSRGAWQLNVGYVPQQIYLLDASVAENIAFGVNRAEINLPAVEKAARMASLHDFICQLPLGYETGVGERGIRLSGGQRQRIAIARALYHDPEVLVFDEATSALDSETENTIVESIQALARQKTIIIVAHRISTLRYCDTIYKMIQGTVSEPCTYADLLAGSK